MRKGLAAALTAAGILAGYGFGQARERDEAVITATVTSADRELVEGYFSLGEQGALMVRPGTELYKFLLRQRGRSVTIR